MAGFATYNDLLETLEDWLAREDFKQECADFVHLAEREMAVIAKIRILDRVITGKYVEGQAWIPSPPDMLEARFLRGDSPVSHNVEIVSIWKWQDTIERLGTTQPNSAHTHGDRIYLGRAPGGAEDYTLFYKGGFPRLTSENQTNFILEQFPQCYLYGALSNAAPYIGADERSGMWMQQAQMWMSQLRKSEARARTGGGKLRIRPDSIDGRGVASGVRRHPW